MLRPHAAVTHYTDELLESLAFTSAKEIVFTYVCLSVVCQQDC